MADRTVAGTDATHVVQPVIIVVTHQDPPARRVHEGAGVSTRMPYDLLPDEELMWLGRS